MDREEILRRAREEGNGEYEDKVYSRVLQRSVLVIAGLCVFFWLARVIHADLAGLATVEAYEFPAIMAGYTAFVYLGLFWKLRNRWHLITGGLFALGFAAFLTQFLLHL